MGGNGVANPGEVAHDAQMHANDHILMHKLWPSGGVCDRNLWSDTYLTEGVMSHEKVTEHPSMEGDIQWKHKYVHVM